jgi:hypothetical protein
MPRLAQHADKLAIIRSMHHRCSAHGKGANRQRIANSGGCFVRHDSAVLSVRGNRQQPCG